ncbi:hypothetical protein DPX16_15620 [Anabarilius grahami]|uniref:Uncharacterized protein n=1 Tax=Anabarilius grahami TaxID=495550 RepID=A0A3N0YD19_ANAGA|nr:hypothetical protein DPX16_15620 [Anabarilius grahami]
MFAVRTKITARDCKAKRYSSMEVPATSSNGERGRGGEVIWSLYATADERSRQQPEMKPGRCTTQTRSKWLGAPKSRDFRKRGFVYAIRTTDSKQKIRKASKQCFEIGHH